MTADLYSCGRGGGKTRWLIEQTEEAISRGERVAILVPASHFKRNADYEVPGWATVYTEKDFLHARGCRYDHIYVDNADLFEDDPAEMCAWIAPGVPVTLTYTPDTRPTLRILATPPDSPEPQPTLSQKEQEYLVLLLALRSGESLRRIMESGIATSAVAAGLLWKMAHDG